jgi:cyclopropane-fatty-acyl-phospholipid synthase
MRALLASLAGWCGRPLVLDLPDGTACRVGDEGGAAVRLRVRNWRFFRRALTGGDIGIGESYMDGDWDCSDLPGLIRASLENAQVALGRAPWTWGTSLAGQVRRFRHANTRAASRRNIRRHYDLGNALFELFLDPSLTYSSALFAAQTTSLEDAQRAKMDGICRALDLRPGQHILEIGCGWGAFALHAAHEYGCRVVGLTLSEEQLRLARERAWSAGLANRVAFRLCDYRDARGTYDHLVSIEMLEAVGAERHGAFFRACNRLLRPGGRMFLQAITVPDRRFDAYRRSTDFIRTHVFPGGCLTSLGAVGDAVRHTELEIDSFCDIGPHYATTLAHWRSRFLARLPEVRRLGYDERFIRMWDFYLASCEAGFATRTIGNAQIVLRRAATAAHAA